MGDEYLETLADVIAQTATSPGAFVARFGGVEFAVLLQGQGLREGKALAEEIRRVAFEMRMPHPETPTGMQTISVGVAASHPSAGSATERVDFLGRAERALDLARARAKPGRISLKDSGEN